jgi:hypothetical protein
MIRRVARVWPADLSRVARAVRIAVVGVRDAGVVGQLVLVQREA